MPARPMSSSAPPAASAHSFIRAAIVDLTTLSPKEGFVIQGDAAGDSAGWSVSTAGDVNGDGFDDLIVGARFGDNGGIDAGEAYVVFGTAVRLRPADESGRRVIDLTALRQRRASSSRATAADDQAGRSVAAAGDLNGDGFDDLIVGAAYGDDGGAMPARPM